MTLPYRIGHDPSGDWAEAESRDAAVLAARTLLEDNEFVGQCRIFRYGVVVDVVWATNATSYTHTNMTGGK